MDTISPQFAADGQEANAQIGEQVRLASRNLERATGIEPALPAWECEFSILYFQYLQNHSEKMYLHALHTVHALPGLRIAGGRLGDGLSRKILITSECYR